MSKVYDGVSIDQDGFSKVDRLQKGIAKALDGGRVGDEVRVVVDVVKGVDFAPVCGGTAPVVYNFRYETGVYPHARRVIDKASLVVVAFVPRGMGNNQTSL
jgi:hypothetical protein